MDKAAVRVGGEYLYTEADHGGNVYRVKIVRSLGTGFSGEIVAVVKIESAKDLWKVGETKLLHYSLITPLP